ncbi:MAG TPA: four-carbon acid sugar kinase family protein [Conexibacter sp.]|jgi:uncharacterized protein YgbK (DUF1537 family)|nr:four-carbon acid sugar kinase family protein [Conexibacter sp.]
MLLDARQPPPTPERLAGCLATLPGAASPAGAAARVAAELHREGAVLVVLDDDPTGSQTVAGVPLLLRFGDDDLAWALSTGSDVVFALTSSRALPEREAVAINRTLAERLATVARGLGADPRIVSRSDSTLRGHFPAEVDAVAEGLRAAGEPPVDGILLCPAFPEAGRVTIGSVHCVQRDGELIPVAETEFAQDPVFGYEESDLRDWAAERTGVAREQIGYVNLADIRLGGAVRVAELLCEVRGGQVVVLDAVTREDLEVLALGVAEAEREGRRFVCRTGPSFVSARAGRALPEPLDGSALAAVAAGDADMGAVRHGLVVVGSHTELTTRQLVRAVARHGLARIELDVAAVARPHDRDAEIARAATATASALACGDVALATSRQLADDAGVAGKAAIASALVAVVERVVASVTPAFLVAKGGITSHELAEKALHAGRATVLGQLFPGQVSVWRLEDGPHAGLPYVVFPGNVGDVDALAATVGRLRGGTRALS